MGIIIEILIMVEIGLMFTFFKIPKSKLSSKFSLKRYMIHCSLFLSLSLFFLLCFIVFVISYFINNLNVHEIKSHLNKK